MVLRVVRYKSVSHSGAFALAKGGICTVGKVIIRKVSYKGWMNCISLSNGSIELIAVTDVGPRIIRFGFVGQPNVFHEIEDEIGTAGSDEYRMYGGHRLWHAPENMPRTYVPDNSPVQWEETENGIVLRQEIEPWTNIRKEMIISMSADTNEVCVRHRLTNAGAWPVEMAPWAISMMAPGGTAYICMNRQDTGLMPSQCLALWPYTRLDDSRVIWGRKYIMIRHDASVEHPFRIGMPNPSGWVAYLNFNTLFIKRYVYHEDASYPDFGSSCEIYANRHMLELGTLGPLTMVNPGSCIDHAEDWSLHANVLESFREKEIESKILPLIGGDV